MQVFFRNCTHILARTQGNKFEDMFLVKIASKGTSLIGQTLVQRCTFSMENTGCPKKRLHVCSKITKKTTN